jgi:hypothetical protein
VVLLAEASRTNSKAVDSIPRLANARTAEFKQTWFGTTWCCRMDLYKFTAACHSPASSHAQIALEKL